MIVNFALAISQNALRLLQRVDGGWAELGQVSSSAPDLAQRLGDLRALARQSAPLGMKIKIIIPNDYVRYLTLPVDQNDPIAVREALRGATPYEVDDLVIDHASDETATYVAAVAREFLNETETFAVDHGLAPVCFTATPREGTFCREVYFGRSNGADRILPAGTELGPDPEPMVIVPLPADREEDAPITFGSVRRGAREIAFAPSGAAPGPAPSAPSSDQEPRRLTLASASPAARAEPVTEPAPAAQAAQVEPAAQAVPVASDAAPRGAHLPPPPADTPSVAPVAGAPLATARAPAETPATRSTDEGLSPGAATAPSLPQPRGLQRDPAPSTVPLSARPDRPAKAEIVFASKARPTHTPPKPSAPKPALPEGLAPPAKPVFRARAAQAAAPAAEEGGPMAQITHLLSRTGGTRFAQAVLAGIAAFALFLFGYWVLSQGTTPPPSEIAQTPVASVPTAARPEPAPSVPAPVPTPAAPPTPVTAPSITPLTVQPQILSTDEARRIYGATGVWQKAPAAPSQPRLSSAELARPSALRAPTPTAQPALPARANLTPDKLITAPPAPPPASERPVLDANGFVPATPEGVPTQWGNIVYAGSPALVPPTRPGTVRPIAPGRRATARVDGVEVFDGAPPLTPPTRPSNALAAPTVALSTPPALPARPALRPRARPQTAQPEAETPPSAAPSVSDAPNSPGLAPTDAPIGTRPSVLPPTRPGTPPSAGGVSLGALTRGGGGLATAQLIARPHLRPQDLAPTPEELHEAATEYAVSNALRPYKRPRNIAQIVSRAKKSAPAPAAVAQSVAPRAVQPSGRVSNTVAARATQNNAINLGRVNLIGVYGSEKNRRALVRLANGRFVKVGVGDRLDGGRVSAIGTSRLQYTKGGRRVTLDIPAS